MHESAAKVLVVDDSQLMHSLYDCLLVDQQLLHAHDGVEALAMLAEHPDTALVLLDVDMPRMDGLTVLRQLRSTPSTRELAVMLVTSCITSVEIAEGMSAGANAYVTKPFAAADLLATVQALLGQQQRARAMLDLPR